MVGTGFRYFCQRATFVHGDMIGLIVFDFILWIIRARMVRVSFVIDIFLCALMIDPPTCPASEFQVT